MKKRFAAILGFLMATTLIVACSSAADDAAEENGAALSQGQGPCGAPLLQVIVRDKEHRFGVDNQQVALNPDIPIRNLCQNRIKASCKDACAKAEAAAVATGVKGFSGSNVPAQLRAMGQLADAFNAALGNKSRFADHPIDQDPGADPSSDPNASTSATVTADAGAAAQACHAPVLQVIVNQKEHRFGVDNHQVALNPAIPIQNICQNGVSAGCKATCNTAANAAAASGVRGFSGADNPAQLRQMGQLADTFNAALGNPTDFTDKPILQ